jgi:hypothetical protein
LGVAILLAWNWRTIPRTAQAAPLAQVEDLWGHTFRAFGFPRGQDTGILATGRLLGHQLTNWVQIEDVKETGVAAETGFSGTPVCDTQVEAVVGMVVAERRTNLKAAFAIPVDVLVGSWPLLELLIHPFVRQRARWNRIVESSDSHSSRKTRTPNTGQQ